MGYMITDVVGNIFFNTTDLKVFKMKVKEYQKKKDCTYFVQNSNGFIMCLDEYYDMIRREK